MERQHTQRELGGVLGDGGMALSREFLTVSGEEPGADGTGIPTSKKIWDFAFSSSSVHSAVVRQGRSFPYYEL